MEERQKIVQGESADNKLGKKRESGESSSRDKEEKKRESRESSSRDKEVEGDLKGREVKGLSGARKVAILLRALGEEKSSEILKRLSEEEVQRIAEEMIHLNVIPKKEVANVLNEFVKLTRQDVIVGSGLEYIQKVLSNVFGPAKAAAIMERMKIFLRVGDTTSISILHDLDAQSIANFIKKEHPQTMAVVLAYLDPKKAIEVLQYLPRDLIGEVLSRVAYLDRLAPGVVEEIGLVLDEEYRAVGGTRRVGGINSLLEVVLNAPPGLEKEILEQIEKSKPELVEELKQRMFTFDDIVKIHNRYIGVILREIDREVLLKALKGASEPVKKKILGAMSERAAKVLKEELETMPPVRKLDVEKAQQEILKVIRRLEQQGEIVVPRGEDVV